MSCIISNINKIIKLAAELSQLSKKPHDEKITPDEIEGGTFTITNLRRHQQHTPIVNHPEVAIPRPVRAGKMEPEWINE